jgi:adenylate cyclase class 2
MPVNMEIKARCKNPDLARAVLKALEADFIGLDCQTDTYFNVSRGRLKMRTGNIENALIHYDRADQEGPKSSQVTLFPTTEGSALSGILEKSLGIKVVVEKEREIYFLGNVTIHIDRVATLGDFVEIEVIDRHGNIPAEELLATCRRYMQALDISEEDLVSDSYSDQILRRSK